MKVKEALLDSFGMLKERPKFVLPMLVPLVLGMGILGLTLAAGVPITGVTPTGIVVAPPGWYIPTVLALTAVVFVVGILIYGMYPSMVKDRIEKKELNFKDSFLFAYHKFWSLLGASLLAMVIIFAIVFAITIPLALTENLTAITIGVIAMIIVIFLISVFFYYILPAIIMDDLKAIAGFKKSWGVGRKNYLFTLLIYLIPSLIIGAVYGLLIGLPAYLGLETIYISVLMIPYAIITLFVSAWIYIIMAYAYNSLRA
jgi:membrane-anchored glycerophosphoryl diester phosphodiesterase (GDPDase)